ncbi:MAG: response regulator, partial [Sulfurimonas sp.]
TENDLNAFSSMPEELILLTKSYYMRKIDSMGLDIFKTLYEPLNTSKLKLALENFNTTNFSAKKSKKVNRKKYNVDSSRFNANVLVAEDNIINQKLIKRTLEDLGLTIDIASNGLEAFQKRKDGNYDLIFMDIQMPFLDGMEATKEILEYEELYNQPHVPILALTANALKGDRERFLEAGLDEYTTKPLVRAEIVTLLNHFLSDYIIYEEELPHREEDDDVEETEEFNEEIPGIETQEATEEFSEATMDGQDVIEESEEQPAENDFEVVENTEESIEEIEPEIPQYDADVLIANYSSFNTKLIGKILTNLSFEYDTVNNVDALNEKLGMYKYKVVLLDSLFKEAVDSEIDANILVLEDSVNKEKLQSALEKYI